MANASPVMIWVSGVDKLCTYFNRTWLDFTGRTMEQEVGNGWAEGVHPDDFDRCLDIYVNAFDARRPFSMEYRLLRHDGVYRVILDSGVPRYDPTGEFAGYIGSCIDITERKEAEEVLLERERSLERILDAVPAAIWATDANKDAVYVNRWALNFVGRTMEQEKGQGWVDAIHPDDADACLQKFTQAFDARDPYTIRYRIRRFDGAYRSILDSATPRYDAQGAFLGYIGNYIDITDWQEADEMRRETEQRLLRILETTAETIISMDAARRIIIFNQSAEKRFGYTAAEVIGQPVNTLFPEEIFSAYKQRLSDFINSDDQT
ncbi:MAG: PAS domain S-box protein, partial [Anaerolineae bacterium]|nr:PAS domain S-box protein [Anaerolineae bacterium]